MDQDWLISFRDKLERHYAWPALYIFKFIVPHGQEEEVKRLFPRHEAKERSSKNGKYTSVTVQMMASSSEEIIEIYVKAAEITGLIAL